MGLWIARRWVLVEEEITNWLSFFAEVYLPNRLAQAKISFFHRISFERAAWLQFHIVLQLRVQIRYF